MFLHRIWDLTQDTENDSLLYNINLNYNIVAQEGLFILNMYPNLPLGEAIAHRFNEKHGNESINLIKDNKKQFICYDIHKSLKQYLLKKLIEKGINKDYVFPSIVDLSSNVLNSYLEHNIPSFDV